MSNRLLMSCAKRLTERNPRPTTCWNPSVTKVFWIKPDTLHLWIKRITARNISFCQQYSVAAFWSLPCIFDCEKRHAGHCFCINIIIGDRFIDPKEWTNVPVPMTPKRVNLASALTLHNPCAYLKNKNLLYDRQKISSSDAKPSDIKFTWMPESRQRKTKSRRKTCQANL